MASATTKNQNSATPELKDLTPEQQRELLQRLLREKAERAKVYPMSPGQQGLWHVFKRNPKSTHFNMFLPTRVRGTLDVELLKSAFEFIVQRHASLRTTFSAQGGKLLQRVHDSLPPDYEVFDQPGASEAEVNKAITKEMQRPFDLENGPLMRVAVFRLADDDWIVFTATHHIVGDFWSMVIVMNDMRLAFPDLELRKAPELPACKNNYADFVREQHGYLETEKGAHLKKYWKDMVDGVSPVLDLPTDFVRPNQFTHRAAVHVLSLTEELSARVVAFASKHRVTSFAVVQSALQALLSRYSGQKKFFIGSPFSGRSQQAYENTVGFFVNMLPVKADLEGDPSFHELTQRTTRVLLGALEHEAYPISEIVRNASLPRDGSRSPLFQASCTFERAHIKEESSRAGALILGKQKSWEFAGTMQENYYVPHPTCHYDLEFIFEQTDQELRGMLCYCEDLFTEATAKQIASNYVSLLDALITHPDTPLSSVSVPVVAQLCASEVGSTDVVIQAEFGTVDGMLAHAAKVATIDNAANNAIESATDTAKSQVALQIGEQEVTYEQLLYQSSYMAGRLAEIGVKRGSIVPVIGECCPEVFSTFLAVNQVGAAFIPLDSSQPSQNIAELVSATRAAAVVSVGDESVGPASALADTPLLQVARSELHASQESSRFASCSAGSDLAYIVYTSGSTGKPKGVMVDHSAVVNTLEWRKSAVPLDASDRVLMLLSHQFDAGLGIAWTTLTQGATLVWADKSALGDAERMIDQILRDRITVLPAVPSLLRILVSHPRFIECEGLRYIWTGGEAMPPELPRQIRSVSLARFWNFYGPTEAAIEATACEVTNHDAKRPVPIGRAITNTEVLILDEKRRVVPPTMPGEIAIGGAGLARGYFGAPELTEAKFIAHPNDASGQKRVYLTGDHGRFNALGEIEFLGRNDHQVKLRGYRIELGEIESVLSSHYLVDRAAVKVIGEGSARAQMLAFVSLEDATAAKANDALRKSAAAIVRRFASENLPAYKMPNVLVVLEEMPVTSSGKVDRNLLPSSVSADLLEQQMIEPSTALEKYLAVAWCEVLGLEKVGANINFFDAGGSSLQAAMLTSELTESLGVHVPTALLFDLADITQVATRLVELHPGEMTQRFGAKCIAQQLEQSSLQISAGGEATQFATHPLIAPLKPSGLRSPIFMVHPPGGIVMCYRELAMSLTNDQPLFAIRSHGLHGAEELPQSVEAMASAYLVAVRATRPKGPYVLGGWSLGGLIAYEMARQLLATGEKVTRIIMLDTTIPSGSSPLVPESEQVNVGLEYGIDFSLEELAELPPEEQLPFLWDHAKKLGVLDENSPPEVVSQALEDLQGLFSHHVECSSRYKIEPLDVDVVLYRPQDMPHEMQVAHDRGWGHLAKSVTVDFIPGHHHSMVQSPNVQVLANKLVDLE